MSILVVYFVTRLYDYTINFEINLLCPSDLQTEREVY